MSKKASPIEVQPAKPAKAKKYHVFKESDQVLVFKEGKWVPITLKELLPSIKKVGRREEAQRRLVKEIATKIATEGFVERKTIREIATKISQEIGFKRIISPSYLFTKGIIARIPGTLTYGLGANAVKEYPDLFKEVKIEPVAKPEEIELEALETAEKELSKEEETEEEE